jgi:hypothetical protein
VILALLTKRTVEEAAIAAQVGARTLYRWLREDQLFIAAYREARAFAVSRAVGRLQQVSSEAAETLKEIMSDGDAATHSRVAAAARILEFAIRATELEELKARIVALEQHHTPPLEIEGEASIVSTD